MISRDDERVLDELASRLRTEDPRFARFMQLDHHRHRRRTRVMAIVAVVLVLAGVTLCVVGLRVAAGLAVGGAAVSGIGLGLAGVATARRLAVRGSRPPRRAAGRAPAPGRAGSWRRQGRARGPVA